MSDDIVPLPAFLDPLLGFISQYVSPETYDILLTFLSHAIALISGLNNFVSNVIASKPWEWDAQKVIPPLITILAAYLALVSLYRTTSWMVRTTFWLFKWGSILSLVAGGVGWFLGNGGAADIARNGVVTTVGNLMWEFINNGQTPNTAGQTRSRRPGSQSRQRKPNPWDKFDQHQQWRQTQYQDQPNAQNVMGDILNAASKVARDSGWWDLAKGVLGQQQQEQQQPEAGTSSRAGKKKKESTSRSR